MYNLALEITVRKGVKTICSIIQFLETEETKHNNIMKTYIAFVIRRVVFLLF